MNCPDCSLPTSVLDVRHKKNWTYRRRECPTGHRFTTKESLVKCKHKHTESVVTLDESIITRCKSCHKQLNVVKYQYV